MLKKIVITGATGLIGKHLTAALKSKGYEVVAFSRNTESAKEQLPIADRHVEWKIGHSKNWTSDINGAYAVINLAGAPISGKRWNAEYKEDIRNSRVFGTRELVLAMAAATDKPEVFISASAIGYYGDKGDSVLTETSEAGNDFLANVCVEWEKEALETASIIRTVTPRIGVVLDKSEGAYPQMTLPIKFFVGGKLGSGEQWFSWIHIDDIVAMFLWVLESPNISGAVNFVSPNPLTNEVFTKKTAKSLKRPAIFTVPEFALKIVLGESTDFILSSLRVEPKVAIENNFSYKYPILEKALEELNSK